MSETLAVTVAEAALRLGVSERTIWRRIRSGELVTEREGRQVRVLLAGSALGRGALASEVAVSYGVDDEEKPPESYAWPFTPEKIRKAEALRRIRRETAITEMERLAATSRPDADGLTVVDYLRDLRDPGWEDGG